MFSGFLILMENLNNVNFNKAIKQFILAYCTPELQSDNIILGNQNNVVLPETEDYAVFHIIDMQRRGKVNRVYFLPTKTMIITCRIRTLFEFRLNCIVPMATALLI